jgi:hypothetical protein
VFSISGNFVLEKMGKLSSGLPMTLCGMAILAMVFHGLEARATLHKYAITDGIRELLKRNHKGIWRSTPRNPPQCQISLFNP